MRTKAAILQSRLEVEELALKRDREYIEGLKETPCNLECSGCGAVLETEWDFASHFVIPDERFLNLGNCPSDPR